MLKEFQENVILSHNFLFFYSSTDFDEIMVSDISRYPKSSGVVKVLITVFKWWWVDLTAYLSIFISFKTFYRLTHFKVIYI